MALLLGVDTGGTYTDAVLVEDETRVIAKAKALTTKADLSVGIGGAVRAVLAEAGVAADTIAMAALSTTLATNALVEGQGGRVGLVLIGFSERDLDKHGLRAALKGDPCVVLAGGHTHAGSEAVPFDEDGLQTWLQGEGSGVSAYAVAGQFATRNPAHETLASAMIATQTDRPVSASHHLSAKLGGPKRALTALLNARLVGMTHRLIGQTRAVLLQAGISAPLMVVRGDGALMSAAQAEEKPIETILSGPAASIVGARWLTGAETALVSDIGGTTTDIALLRDGRPAIDPHGAMVGGWRTMVEAVAMRTSGLGGDSAVRPITEGLTGGVFLGPDRLVPVSLIAQEAPDVVLPCLEAQLRNPVPGEFDAGFVRALPGPRDGLGPRELTILERIADSVHPLGSILKARVEHGALSRLISRGLVQVAGVTPSDAAHVLGLVDAWDRDAAASALSLLARRRTGSGDVLAESSTAMAQIIVDQLMRQTVQALLEVAFEEDGVVPGDPATLSRHPLMLAGLDRHAGLVRIETALGIPVVGLGASAKSYYPAVGDRLSTDAVLPPDGDVANAIGAVVGRITLRRQGSVTAPSEGRYRVHLEDGPEDFGDADKAMDRLQGVLSEGAREAARQAGAEDIELSAHRDIRRARAEAREVFLEAIITVEASGRPRIAG